MRDDALPKAPASDPGGHGRFLVAVLDAVGALVGVADTAGRIVHLNRAFEEASGYRLDEVRGRPFWEFGLPEAATALRALFANPPPQGRQVEREHTLVMRGGERRVIALTFTRIADENGAVHVVASGVDVTEIRRAETELRLHSLVVQGMGEAALAVDDRGTIVFTNPPCDAMFGYERGELIGRSASTLNAGSEEERQHVLENTTEILRRAGRFHGTFLNRRKDGTPMTTRARIRRAQAPGGVVYVSVQEDVTERLKAEAALREAEQRYRELVENIPDLVYVTDEKGVITYVSPAAARFGGYRADEVTGRPFSHFVHPDDRVAVTEGWRRYRRGHSGTIEFRSPGKDGRVRWFRSANRPLFEDGRFRGVTGITSDMTARRKAEEDAQRRREELAHVLRLHGMGEMASGLAHELNQPLGAIANYVDACARLLASDKRERAERLREAVARIGAEALRASQIVGTLRRFVRGEAERPVRSDLNQLVGEVLGLLASETRADDVAVESILAVGLPDVEAEPVQIEQVIFNLVRNGTEAVRGTGGGRGRVSVRTSIDAEGWPMVAVSDTGPGIPDDVAAKVFEPFFTTKPGGMGMGLSISRSIIEAHGGRLGFAPNPGGGVTLHFALPPCGGRRP